MFSLKNLFRWPSEHAEVRSLGAKDRRRIYQHLLALEAEERRAKELLNLLVEPRLSVVDEERVTILRPRDRVNLADDPQMREAKDAEKARAASGRRGK
jgi:hypothetical protein